MKSSARRMVVFYGSQTGTAEEFAGRLAKEGARYGCKARNGRKWLSLGEVLTRGVRTGGQNSSCFLQSCLLQFDVTQAGGLLP